MIPLYKVFMPDGLGEKIGTILQSGSVSYGQNARSFENKLRRFIGNELCYATSANPVFLALKSIGIGPGDEVIASPMMCLASSQPVVTAGAKIVWADIDPYTGSLDPSDVKQKITAATKAIIHFHWGGQLGFIDEILSIAHDHGIRVIEDATESFGAHVNGRMLGNHGADVTCFAFTPVRIPSATEGGAVAFRDKAFFDLCGLIRDYGINRRIFRDSTGEIDPGCDIPINGDGMLMTELPGFIGDSQMDNASLIIGAHRRNAELLDSYFRESKLLPLSSPHKKGSVYWVYTVLTDRRDEWMQRFRDKGFYSSKMHYRNDMYSVFGRPAKQLKGVSEFSSRELNIPCGWWVSQSDLAIIKDI